MGQITSYSRKLILTAVLFSATLAHGQSDSSICNAFSDIQDSHTNTRVSNCQLLFSQPNLVPNQEALSYTLRYLRDNYKDHGLSDPSCALKSKSLKQGVLNPQTVSKGIENGCQFVINDLNKEWEGFPKRTTVYLINLCAKPGGNVVQTFYMNTGTGSKFRDRENAHSTLAGAFLTNSEISDFHPYRLSRGYRDILNAGKLWALRLIGLNSSNNNTDYSKPIHVSPYVSSWGCPSVGPESAQYLKELAENGPSLLMNYGPSSFHQNPKMCFNTKGHTDDGGHFQRVRELLHR